MRLKKAVKSAIRGLVRSNAKDRPIAAWDRKVRIGRKFSQNVPDLVSNTPHWSEIPALLRSSSHSCPNLLQPLLSVPTV